MLDVLQISDGLYFIVFSQTPHYPILTSMESNGITDNNFYEILGISHEADDDEIANAYEAKLSACDELANELDSNGLAPEDIKELRGVLIRAFKTLVDPVKRTQYDSKIFGNQEAPAINNTQQHSPEPVNTEPNFVIKDSPNNHKDSRHSQRKASGINTQRSRSFQEFPGIPNLVAPAVKSDRPKPVARLNDTATISPAEANIINEHCASDQTENIPPEVKEEKPTKHTHKTSAQSFKPVSGQYDVSKIRTEAINVRSRKMSGDLPRAAINDIRNASQLEPRSKMEVILIFCAFVLPMISLIFAIIYLLAS